MSSTIRKILLVFLPLLLSFTLQAQVKILFDATKAETAGNADWVIDADLHNIGYTNGPAVVGQGNESNPQRYPTPDQSTVTQSTAETYWEGGISSWGIECVKHGYQVESLPYNGQITYGNSGNAQDLSNYKVFVVCEPNIVFTAAEKTALMQFIQNGGGLFMVSDHDVSDRNNDGWDSPRIWDDFISNNGVLADPFGITFDYANFSQTTSNIPNLPTDPLLHGVMGDVTQAMWSNGTSITMTPSSNSSVVGVVYKTGSSFGNTNVMVAHATYGNGKVVAFGDSSPCDDGSGDPGDQLYDGWLGDAGGNHRKLIMNATIWLATSSVLAPTVTTLAAGNITGTSATLNGSVNPNNVSTTWHFEWGTSVSYGNSTPSVAAGSGSSVLNVNANISGLVSGTTYHFRLAAQSSAGTSYGADLSFTPGTASVITVAASAIGMTTATSGGNVISDGGLSVTARGVCWSTAANPVISGSHTTDGSGLGVFTSSVTGLTSNTLYHLRAYATNAGGTAYGDDQPFTTACGTFSLPFTESFSGTTIPGCWTQVDHQGNGEIWSFGTITTQTPNPTLTGNYAYLNSDAFGSGNSQNVDLVTPSLDLTSYSSVNLQFRHYFRSYTGSSGTLSYSINNGSSWTTIQQFTTTSASNPALFNQSIPAVAGHSQVEFKWNYTATWGHYWAIDDVSITGTSSPTLAVTPSNQNVAYAAGNTLFDLVSNSAWTATSSQSWCTVTPSGTGNGQITATYTQNTSGAQRVASVTVTVAGLSPVVVTVTQALNPPTLSVTPPNQNVTSAAGNTLFDVVSNSAWTATSSQSWCTVTPSGTGNGQITASYTQNTSGAQRVASVTVTVAGLSPVVVTVTQAIPALNLTVTPSNHDVTASAGTALFDVATASAWTAGSNQSWCTVTPSGTGNGTLSAVYLQNSSGAQRIASITVTVTGLPPVVVTVTQALNSPTLLVTPANQNVTETAGNTTFTVTSNSAWAATVNQSWCMVTPSGNGNGLITATYETNYTISPRVASITVTVPGIDPVTVTVTQAAGAATLIVTPDNRNVASDAGSTNFSVNSNSAWQAGSNASWCMITTSGNGSGTLLANYTTNPLATERIATLQVTVAGLSPVNVTVTQAGAPATLIVAPPLQTVAKSAGTTTFSVSSNASWLASSDVIWCSPTHSGSGNGTLTADYLENTGTALRTANILVTVPGALSQTVKVEQLPTTVSVPENPIALLSLYPNPTSGIFRISSESVISNLEVTLLDNSGKLLFVRHCSGETFYLFNLTGYPKGNYLVKVKTADKSMTWKLTLK